MVKVIFVTHDGKESAAEGRTGDSVMATAIAHGIDGIVGECGGSMMCATCHVHVDEKWISATGERVDGEEDMLEGAASATSNTSRLCCQIKLTPDLDGVVVHLPKSQV